METEATANSTMESSNYRPLYKLGGVAAAMMGAIIVIQIAAFLIAPPPYTGTVLDWFRLFQDNQIIGLIHFELLMVIYTLLSVPVALALYTCLRGASLSFTAVYLALSLVGVIAFIAARPAIEMLNLSNEYAAATTEAQKSMLLSAGQAMIAAFHGTAFHVSYLLGSLTGVMISFVMLKARIFSKATAYLRIASGVCDLGLYIPSIGMYIALFSVFFLLAWNILIARRLLQLGQNR